ncbi:MAG: hypothetical protein ACREON_17075 [Gemmatimonadaceae bacterium]
MQAEILVLRLVHILGGIFWVGSSIFTSFFLFPSLTKAGPAAGQVMAGLQQRRLFIALPVVALLTMLSGLRLMWIASGGFSSTYFATPSGRTYTVSALAAIVGFVVGLAISRPAAARIGGVAQKLASAPEADRAPLQAELETLRRRASVSSLVAVLLLVLAAAGMAVGRYM